jgi:hypothetical protein
MIQSVIIFIERKSRKVDNKGKSDLMAELVEIRVMSGGLSKVDRFHLKKFIGTPQKVSPSSQLLCPQNSIPARYLHL